MRAMRNALLSVRSARALPRPSARAPSRLVSTDPIKAREYIDAMMLFAAFIGLVTAVGYSGTHFHSRMSKLEAEMVTTAANLKEIEGSAATLKSDMAATAATLKSDIEGSVSTLKSGMAATAATLKSGIEGAVLTLKFDTAATAATLKSDMAGLKEAIVEEVDAKNAGFERAVEAKITHLAALGERVTGTVGKLEERVTGVKETITREVDAKNAGSEKVVEAKIIAFEKAVAKEFAWFKEAADLKVRFLLRRARARARFTLPLTRRLLSPLSTRPSDALIRCLVAVYKNKGIT